MVCVPCFIIPVLLFVWHKFIQPILLRYWNPWAKKDENVKEIPFPFQCAGGKCPFPQKKDQITDKKDEKIIENDTVEDKKIK